MTEKIIHNGRDYTKSVYDAIHRARTKAAYPESSFHQGIKTLHGERYLFNLIIEGELKKGKVPKALRKKLLSK